MNTLTALDPRGADTALRDALTHHHLSTVFQPIFAPTGRCYGFEALTRFANGCPPEQVWAKAESDGVAAALDAIALSHAWHAGHLLPGLLFLNVSATCGPPLVPEFPVDPTRVVWEVTEHTPLSRKALQSLNAWHAKGSSIALDDAGTGHATLKRLGRLRPRFVKLDRSLVAAWRAGLTGPLRTWVNAAHVFGALVIAEGIEDVHWFPDLARDGVRFGQGFGLAVPASAEWFLSHGISTIN